MTQESATRLAEKVIKHMLAPGTVSTSPNDDFFRLSTTGELELRLRWQCNARFTSPGMFIDELERMLRPISEAITYGEVKELRAELADLQKKREIDAKEMCELRRYRDALLLLKGSL